MSIIDIRNETSEDITRIRFADDQTCRACFITRKTDGKITLEDADMDGEDWPLNPEDVDNFIKARYKARALGWNI